MRLVVLRAMVVSGVVALASAGCDSMEDLTSGPDTTVSSDAETVPDDQSDASADGGDDQRRSGQRAGPAGAISDLDIQQRHPNGTVLRVLGVTLADTSTSVEVEAINGFTEAIILNDFGIHLVDDLGNAYNFIEPEQNAELEVAPGAVLSGTLTFLGRIEADASSLRLLVNTFEADDTVDLEARFELATSPEFQIDDIPIPGR